MNDEWIECTDVEASKAKKAQAFDMVDGWRPVEFDREFAQWADDNPGHIQTVVGRRWRRAVEEPESESCPISGDYATAPDGSKHHIMCLPHKPEHYVYSNGDLAPTPTLPCDDQGRHGITWVHASVKHMRWEHATHVVFRNERVK